MNKKVLIGLVVVVLVIAGGWFAYSQSKDKDDTQTKSSTDTAENTDDSIFGSSTNTLRGLLGYKNAVCTYSDQDVNGVIYVANKDRMRYNFTSVNPDHPSGGMIMTDDVQYIWDDATKEGFMIRGGSDDEDVDSEGSSALNEDDDSIDLDQEYEFDCKKWSVDQSIFTPPSDVTFADMDELIRQQEQQLQL